VDHGKGENVRYETGRVVIHTNTGENFFSVFKRGMRGVYQHCKEKHLLGYLAEFDFRHNNRSALGVEGKGTRDQDGCRRQGQAVDLPCRWSVPTRRWRGAGRPARRRVH
jgi:hypothetical protein